MNEQERRRFKNNKLPSNAVKWRRRLRGERPERVKRDFDVILVIDIRSFSEWRQKVFWIQERTKIEMMTGRVITQQDRPHVHKSHQTHYCLLLLLSFCPSASSLFPTRVISPASVRGFTLLLPDLSWNVHVSPRKSWRRDTRVTRA